MAATRKERKAKREREKGRKTGRQEEGIHDGFKIMICNSS